MDEGDAGGCEHDWLLVRAVLDGAGSWRVFRCSRCQAEAVQPASGDL